MTLPGKRRKGFILGALALVCSVGLGSYAALAAGKPTRSPNPDAKLTTEQRDSFYRQAEQDFQRRYAEWLRSPGVQAQDLRRLERQEMAGSYVPGEPSLDAAKRKADVAVTGVVSAVRFEPSRTFVTFHVERFLKGQSADDIVVKQGGGLFPDKDFQHASLVVSKAEPPLLPGDRAALLLQRSTALSETFSIQPFSGEYVLLNGRVRATPGNSFGAEVDGRPESEFISRLSS